MHDPYKEVQIAATNAFNVRTINIQFDTNDHYSTLQAAIAENKHKQALHFASKDILEYLKDNFTQPVEAFG